MFIYSQLNHHYYIDLSFSPAAEAKVCPILNYLVDDCSVIEGFRGLGADGYQQAFSRPCNRHQICYTCVSFVEVVGSWLKIVSVTPPKRSLILFKPLEYWTLGVMEYSIRSAKYSHKQYIMLYPSFQKVLLFILQRQSQKTLHTKRIWGESHGRQERRKKNYITRRSALKIHSF